MDKDHMSQSKLCAWMGCGNIATNPNKDGVKNAVEATEEVNDLIGNLIKIDARMVAAQGRQWYAFCRCKWSKKASGPKKRIDHSAAGFARAKSQAKNKSPTGKRSTSPVEFKPSELPVMKMPKNYTHRQSPSPGTFTPARHLQSRAEPRNPRTVAGGLLGDKIRSRHSY